MNSLIKAAQLYKSFGLSVVPVNFHKKSLINWEPYQHEIITDKELRKVFRYSGVDGIAIICGEVSGNLEVIDVDSKHDLTTHLFDNFYTAIQRSNADVASRLCIGATRNKGYHFYYKCPVIENNRVLARRSTTQEELLIDPNDKIRVLLETRGRGGYIIVYPTPGYQFIQHDLGQLPIIQPDQRLMLIDIAKSFNLYVRPRPTIAIPSIHYYDNESPLNDYDARGDIIGLLEYHGWKFVRYDGVKTYFRRPGITDHDTSGDFHHGLNLFGVFTTSTEFERKVGYRPCAVYAFLECNKDFKLAARRLLAEGYGVPYNKRRGY